MWVLSMKLLAAKLRRGRDTPGIEHPIRAAESLLPSRCAGFLLGYRGIMFSRQPRLAEPANGPQMHRNIIR
jgi:hypothetical protein